MVHTRHGDEGQSAPASIAPSASPASSVPPETWIAFGILGLTLLAYLQVLGFSFISLDDPLYITNNPNILMGLSWNSLHYAFTSGADGSYLPLVWLSHAACASMFGTWAGGHHLVNALLHGANGVLLFCFLNRLTKSLWPSAFVAALFALHPLHVESVAWISERKDVLSTFFWILSSWAYLRYVERPSAPRYFGMVCLFVLGLLSKSMLVTLPFTLLLFDFWPLRRIPGTEVPRPARIKALWLLIWEKTPLVAVSLGAATATFWIQKSTGATDAQAILPLFVRAGNALMSISHYLLQTFWPLHLSPFYPYPEVIFRWRIAGHFVFVLVVSAICLFNLRRRPFLAVGWFWYLITLLPVVGLIQVGSQAHADRYTYVPLIGIFLMLVWLAEECISHWRVPRIAVLATSGTLLGSLFIFTTAQTAIWRDSERLWSHALRLNPRNFLAHQHLGELYIREGRYPEAYVAYRSAADYLQSYSMFIKLGDLLERMGAPEQALIAFQSARGPHIENGRAWSSHPPVVDQRIASCLTRMERFDEAEPFIRRVLQSRAAGSDTPSVEAQACCVDWAIILRARNHFPEALRLLESVLAISPGSVQARVELSLTLSQMGHQEEALRQIKMASDADPRHPGVLYSQGVVLTKLNRFTEARSSFDQMKEIAPHSPLFQKGMSELERAQRRKP